MADKIVLGDVRFKRGPESRFPQLADGEPAVTTDTGKLFFGTPSGNMELPKKEEVTGLSSRVGAIETGLSQHTANIGDLSTLPAWLQENLAFAIKAMYDSMTEINVRTPPYNLKGDGTDESVAIQSLLNLALTNSSVYLYFPEGTYGMSGYLRLYKNTFVRMHTKATIKRLGLGYKVFVNGQMSNTTYATGYNGEGNIHFSGGTIDLNQSTLATDKTVSAFDLGHAENLSFTNLTVKNGQIGHYFQVVGCKNVRFKDCWFGDVVQSSTVSTAYELIQIEAMTEAGFPSFGSYDNTISRDIFIEGCTFKNVIRAIGTHSDAGVLNENIHIKNCTFDTSYDRPLSLMTYKGCVVKDNLFLGSGADTIYLNKVTDSTIEGNTVLGSQKTGIYATSSHGNKFARNILKDVALATVGAYAAIRLISSNNNTFDDNTVTATVPNYTFALFTSDGSVNNRIISHQFTKGKTATISGADATEHANIQIGNGQDLLFDGDLATNGAIGTLTHDIRNYSYIVVVGNDNSSATATLVTSVVPKAILLLGTTSRFRFIADDSNANERIDFSFPTGTSIQADAVLGTCHIRKVIGIV
jgi:parallel beta-helix repeat protein